jgi:hypothetical protein
MTNREMIEKKFPYPMSEMIIRNAIPANSGDWIDRETNCERKYELLTRAFVWSDSPEGHEFWAELFKKLLRKNI